MALSITLNAILTSSQPIPHLFIHPSNRPSITDCYHSFPKTKTLISDYTHCYSWQIFMARTSPHTYTHAAEGLGHDQCGRVLIYSQRGRRGEEHFLRTRGRREHGALEMSSICSPREKRERTGKRAKGFHANISLSCSLPLSVSPFLFGSVWYLIYC